MIEAFLPLLVLASQTQDPKPQPPLIPLRITTEKDQFGVETPARQYACFLSDTEGGQYKFDIDLPAFQATDHERRTKFGSVQIAKNDGATSDVGVRLEFNAQKLPVYSLKFWLESGSLEEAGHSAVRMYIKPGPFGTKVEMWPNVSLNWRFLNSDKPDHPDNLRVKAAGVCRSTSDIKEAEDSK